MGSRDSNEEKKDILIKYLDYSFKEAASTGRSVYGRGDYLKMMLL